MGRVILKPSCLDPDPDVEQMLRVQRDETGAFQELIDRYWPRIFNRFYRQFRDRQEAEDLSQDVFLRVYRNRHRYRPTARLATWVFHIAGNVARNAIRTRQRKPVKHVGTMLEGEHAPLSIRSRNEASESPTSPLERSELVQVVRKAMHQLLDRQRMAVELQFQDRSYLEIAEALKMTAKATKSLLYRARHQLKESLQAYVGEE